MAYAELRDGYIVVTTEWNEKELIKQAPGSRWRAKEKYWTLPLSWGSCIVLRALFGQELLIGEQLGTWAAKYKAFRVDPALALRNRIDDEGIELAYDDARLRPFQRTGAKFIEVAHDVLLSDEMGTGKTVQSLIGTFQKPKLPMLVICPNSVKRHWAAEIENWHPTGVPYVITSSGAVGRRKIIEKAKKDPNAIVIVNIEATRLLSRLAPYGSVRLVACGQCDPKFGDHSLTPSRCDVHPKELNGYGFETVILDEAHRIANPKSKQTRAIWAIMHEASVQQRIALTGTPIAQTPADLWSIMHAIAPYDYPNGRSKYTDRYCLSTWNVYGGMEIVGIRPDRRAEFFAILDPHFRRMMKAQVLPDLPPKVRVKRQVQMGTAQRKFYNELKKSFVARDDDGQLLVTKGRLAAHARLSQCASASVKVIKPPGAEDEIARWQIELKDPSPKLDELEVILDELGNGQAVVASVSKKLLLLAAQRLAKKRISYELITGDISEYDRAKALQRLRDKHVRLLLFTVQAGGTGLDMACVDTLINLQRSWSLVEVKQTEDRVHRFASTVHKSIQIIDIVVEDSIEEDQIDKIHEKMLRLDEITRDRARLEAAGLSTSDLDKEESAIMGLPLYVPGVDDGTE